MVKLLENTFRMINIGLVNEMAMMCDRMGINVWEVIDAAATKPFGFMPFYPGPGSGRPLHPDRPVLSVLEDQAGRHRSALHRTGRLHQRPDAALCGGQVQNALNHAGSRSRDRTSISLVWPTKKISTTCGNPRPWTLCCS